MREQALIASSRAVVRTALFIAGALLAALLLNGALSILTLDRIHTRSLLSSYTVVGDYHVEKIRRSLKFGKSLDSFSGLDRLLAAIMRENPDIAGLAIYSRGRELLLGLGAEIRLPGEVAWRPQTVAARPVVSESGDFHLLGFPIVSAERESADSDRHGFLVLAVPKSLARDKVDAALVRLAKTGVLTGILSVGVLLPALFFLVGKRHGQARKRRILLTTSLVFLGSQLAFSAYGISHFEDSYLDDVREESRSFGQLLQADVDRLLDLGVPIDRLVKIETLLNDILTNTPELSAIAIVDNGKQTLYRLQTRKVDAQLDAGEPAAVSPRYQVDLPLQRGGQTVGAIHLDIDKAVIDKIRFDLAVDLITVAFVSLLVGFELVFFLVALDTTSTPGVAAHAVPAAVRTGAFLYAFAMALSMSFLPLYASQLAPLAGLPGALSMALPLSAEMLLVALGLVLGGHWLERRDWLSLFLYGVVVTAIGVGLCSLAQTTLQLVGCRALVGLGYGLVVVSTQTVVIRLSAAGNRSSAISGLEAGYYAGFISSTAIGGMLADKIGFRGVFVFGALQMLVALAFAFAFLRKISSDRPVPQSAALSDGASAANVRLLSLLADREFLGTLLLSAIPAALCLAGFLYFASPLFLTEAGVSQANIARLMMPYGLCMIYLAPLLGKWVDAVGDKRIPVLLGGVLGGMALLIFHFFHSPLAFVAILILFSVSGGLSYGARLTLVSESSGARRVGVSRALGVFSSLERVGNILGPMLVGSLLVVFSVTAAIGFIGLVFLLCNLLLFLLCLSRRHSLRA